MKNIIHIDNVEKLHFGEGPIIQMNKSIVYLNDNLTFKRTINGDFYYAKVINGNLIFQLGTENNLNIILNDKTITKEGLFGLISAFEVSLDKFYIYYKRNEDPHKFLILNNELEEVKESIPGCNYGYNNFLFRCYGTKLECFNLETNNFVWQSEQTSNLGYLSFSKNNVSFRLENGELINLDIKNGDFNWKRDLVGRICLFNNIYSITNYTLEEIDLQTGNIIKKEGLHELINSYDFRPTGEHMVYNEYIFAMSAGKPGMIAIFDRFTLKFKELIRLEESIPTGNNNLIFFKEKLYVLDSAKTLHVFELDR